MLKSCSAQVWMWGSSLLTSSGTSMTKMASRNVLPVDILDMRPYCMIWGHQGRQGVRCRFLVILVMCRPKQFQRRSSYRADYPFETVRRTVCAHQDFAACVEGQSRISSRLQRSIKIPLWHQSAAMGVCTQRLQLQVVCCSLLFITFIKEAWLNDPQVESV